MRVEYVGAVGERGPHLEPELVVGHRSSRNLKGGVQVRGGGTVLDDVGPGASEVLDQRGGGVSPQVRLEHLVSGPIADTAELPK